MVGLRRHLILDRASARDDGRRLLQPLRPSLIQLKEPQQLPRSACTVSGTCWSCWWLPSCGTGRGSNLRHAHSTCSLRPRSSCWNANGSRVTHQVIAAAAPSSACLTCLVPYRRNRAPAARRLRPLATPGAASRQCPAAAPDNMPIRQNHDGYLRQADGTPAAPEACQGTSLEIRARSDSSSRARGGSSAPTSTAKSRYP